jgi:murein DD-endopeptidase MepM/ murein hydrolase activator NlpD
MSIKITTFLLLWSITALQAQEVRVYTKKKSDNTINFYAANDFIYVHTVKIVFTQATNICPSNTQFFVLEPEAKQQYLFSINPCNANKEWQYKYLFWYTAGDIDLQTYQDDFVYSLPFPVGKEYKLGQGFFGNYSHQGIYAMDFTMPEGSEVCAMRGGIVYLVKEDSNTGGPDKKFGKDGNRVAIVHDDGTIGLYLHFKQNGVVVNVGDEVKKGQLIAYSGNTGFSSNPHLHVEIRLPDFDNKKTVEPKIKSGGKILTIKQGVFYKNER